MYSKSILLLLTTTVALVSCGLGRCPSKYHARTTIWEWMNGDWYEYASYGDGTTRLCYKCMKLSFTKEENEWIVKRDYVLKLFDVTGSSLYAVKQVDNSNFMLEGKGWASNLSMWVLDMVFYNYLILWSCEEHFFGMYHTESSWILTKYPTETPTDQLEEEIKSSLKKQNIDLSWYGPVTQNSCSYNYYKYQ